MDTEDAQETNENEAKNRRNAEEADEAILPDTITFTSSVAKGGAGRLIITVPSGYVGLVRSNETCQVKLTFPYRKLAKEKLKIGALRAKLRA